MTSHTFELSYWWGPPLRACTAERFAELRRLGFTLASVPVSDVAGEYHPYFSEAENHRLLDLAQAAGMRALVVDARVKPGLLAEPGWEASLSEVVDAFKEHPALYGYYLIDEPGAQRFAQLGRMVEHVRARDPLHPAYINLFPNYAPPAETLGTGSYEEYVDRFIAEVRPDLLCYDHYHFLSPAGWGGGGDDPATLAAQAGIGHGPDRPGFFHNLEVLSDRASRHGLPLWAIVLFTPHGPYRPLTAGELNWEAWQALAYGARGLLWFTCWTPLPDVWQFRNGMFAADGTPHPRLEELRELNHAVLGVGRELERTRWLGTYRVGDTVVEGPESLWRPQAGLLGFTGGDLTIGCFEGDRYLVTNRNYRASAEVSLELAPLSAASVQAHDKPGWEIASWDMQHARFRPAITARDPYNFILPPGGAALLHVQAEPAGAIRKVGP